MSHEPTFFQWLPGFIWLCLTLFCVFRGLQAAVRTFRIMDETYRRAKYQGYRGKISFDLSTTLLPLLRWLTIIVMMLGAVPVIRYLTS